ncbi:signal peptide peptidase SppA [bacterium]|nr:signal peptide peptidase SppA [bacterium]
MVNLKNLNFKKILIVIVIILFSLSAFFSLSPGEKIAIIEIKGVIKSPKEYLESIREIDEDDSFKGVIVRIDSPGGTVGSSQEIYESLNKLSKKIPTISSIIDIGASGGYMIACGTSYIFANSGSITGSIGVISQYYDFSKLIKFLRFEIEIVKSGKMKDIGNPAKKLTEKEKKLLNILVKDIHEQFKSTVAKERGLSEKEVELISDGRIFSGKQALTLKLVDEIGGLDKAIDYIKENAGIDSVNLEHFPKKEKKLLESIVPSLNNSSIINFLNKKLYYLYSPKF